MSDAGPTTRILVVDDDPIVRGGLALMLGGSAGLEIVGEAANGREGLDAVRAAAPREPVDVVLMDLRMPVMDGIAATRELRAAGRLPRVIVLTTFDADEHVVRALAAGADGFLLKDTRPADLVEAIRRVAAGEPMLSPTVTAGLIRRVTDGAADDRGDVARRRLSVLTERELEVAVAIGGGASNAEVAEQLHVSLATVKAHIGRILTKLDATNRVQVAICVHDAGLL